MSAPAEERRRADSREPATEERVVEVGIPGDARDGGALAILERERLDRLVGRRQREGRHRVVEDGRDHLGDVHAEQERIDPAVHLDADGIDEDERREPVGRHRRQLGRDPAAEGGAREMDAVEPELVEQIEIVEREVGDVVDPLGGRGAAVAGMAREIDRELLRERLLEVEPAPGAPCTVQEEQRRARAVLQQVDRSPADGELAVPGHLSR